MDFALNLVISGLGVGALYALIAIGLNLTFWTTRTLNFGQGTLLMLAAMLTAFLAQRGYAPWLGVLAALLAVTVAMLLIERICVRPVLRTSGSMGWAVSTLGAGILLQGIASKYFGTQAMAFPELVFRASDYLPLAGHRVSLQYLLILGVAVALVAALELFLRRTVWGRAIRAVVNDKELASVLAIPVNAIVLLSFVVSGFLAGLAGLMTAQILGAVDPAFGFDLMIFGFVAAVTGGMGSNWGALLGGLVIGLLEKLTAGYVSSGAGHAVVFGILILVLALRPHGLLGRAEAEKA